MRTVIIDIGWRHEREEIIMHKSKATNSTMEVVKDKTCWTNLNLKTARDGSTALEYSAAL